MKLNIKKKSKRINDMIYYDSNTRLAYVSSGDSITPYVKKFSSKSRIVSTFPFDALMKTTIEVPKTIDEVDVDTFITESVYKQLNMQQGANFEIYYCKVDLGFDADNWSYDVYLVDDTYLENTYSDLKEKTQFVDIVTSVPFLPLVLYKTDKLDDTPNHIFVFIGESSGTFSFYSKGELIYTKILSSNIHKLRVEFNQESSLELNSIEFENLVAGKSPQAADYKTYLDSMLNKISRDIEENIMYVKRVYQDLDPTAIYYGMSIEYNEEFLPFFRDSFLIETKPYNSLSSIPVTKGLYAVADISMVYASYLISNVNADLPNFSHAKRPKPLSQRDSYQFVVIAAGLFALSLIYPIYNFVMMNFYSVRSNMLQSSYDTEIFPKAEQYRADEARLNAQIDNLKKQKDAITLEISGMRNDMGSIRSWQVEYIQKSKILNDILKVAENSKVRVIKATANSSGDNRSLVVELNLFSRTQQDISDFIKALNDQGIYKNVITDRVIKIGLEEDSNASSKAGSVAQSITTAATNVAQAVSNAITTQDNNSTIPQVDPIPANIDLSGNEELDSFVKGYLNSIVRVVVR